MRIHLPDYSFPEKEQGSLQFVAASPCFLWYQQNPEVEDLAEGAGVGERQRGGLLAALEHGGNLVRFVTALTGASSKSSARILTADEEKLLRMKSGW